MRFQPLLLITLDVLAVVLAACAITSTWNWFLADFSGLGPMRIPGALAILYLIDLGYLGSDASQHLGQLHRKVWGPVKQDEQDAQAERRKEIREVFGQVARIGGILLTWAWAAILHWVWP